MTINQNGLFVQPEQGRSYYEIEFQLDDRTFVATSGTFLHSPKGQITSTPPLSSEDLNKILTTAPKYGIEIVPPPSK